MSMNTLFPWHFNVNLMSYLPSALSSYFSLSVIIGIGSVFLNMFSLCRHIHVYKPAIPMTFQCKFADLLYYIYLDVYYVNSRFDSLVGTTQFYFIELLLLEIPMSINLILPCHFSVNLLICYVISI